jgi:hypothetical protein
VRAGDEEDSIGVRLQHLMTAHEPEIVIVRTKLAPPELARLTGAFFEDMIKYVVDIERRVAAVGGELRADAEQLLLAEGAVRQTSGARTTIPGRAGRSASNTRPSSTSGPLRETGAC